MNSVTVKERQTLLDLAIQTSGSVEAAFRLAEANDVSLTDELVDGTVLQTVAAVEPEVVRRFEVERLTPATGISAEDKKSVPYEGIGVMGIEIGFVVS